jgi:hypothetical protein
MGYKDHDSTWNSMSWSDTEVGGAEFIHTHKLVFILICMYVHTHTPLVTCILKKILSIACLDEKIQKSGGDHVRDVSRRA